MIKTIIASHPKEKREARKDGSAILHIAECFSDTIQGENFVGYPSTFLRLQWCTLSCVWCDTGPNTTNVWTQGNPYSVDELLEIWEKEGVIDRFSRAQHLILTGGSPLRQQDALTELLKKIKDKCGFSPFTEIENECTLMPTDIKYYIDRWNNSPKLENSGMNKKIRYKPDILRRLSLFRDSWFKFVITSEEDWKEIVEDFIKPGLMRRQQIVLMPEGQMREELQERYEWLVDLCCREGVRFTNRLHITIWDQTTGV
ncbi:hypothetical protein CMI37_35510 [Candidatus Pacearchaeota archaeon]|nr:hypothetical protein [Candidatus Pacearchaeota archaeon]|tara:strand:+ start:4000 stop:4770 length:771 start_codon:yes stop_codon:yes gene_type:complete